MTLRLACCALLLLVAIGCGDGLEPVDGDPPAKERDPAQDASAALKAMLALAEEGRWGEYVDRFYGEKAKFTSPEDRAALIERFETRWGPTVLEALRRAAPLIPRIQDGKAVFEDEQGPAFLLHQAQDGTWTFHL